MRKQKLHVSKGLIVTDSRPAVQSRPSRFWLYLPSIVVLIVAVAVSVWWWVSIETTSTAIDYWIRGEAEAGRVWQCADRSMGGYPFRIEVRCSAIMLEAKGLSPISVTLGPVTFISQIYQTRLTLAETTGPLLVSTSDGAPRSISWSNLRVSLHVDDRVGPDRLAVVVDSLVDGNGWSVAHGELHLRQTPASNSDQTDLEFAVSADGLRAPFPVESGATGVRGRLTRGGLLLRGNPGALEDWRKAAGQFVLDEGIVKLGAATLRTMGTLTLDDGHRPAGSLDVETSGLSEMKAFSSLGALGGVLSAGTIKAPLVFARGRMSLGPFKLAEMPPLY